MNSASPLGVLVQAGGLGRRLGALSADRPKALVPFAGTTLLDHQLSRTRALGATRTCVLACAAPAAMTEATAGRAELLLEGAPLGTAGGLALLPDAPDAWLVLNVDHVSDVDLEGFVRAGQEALAAGDAGLALIVRREVRVDEGVVEIEEAHITGWAERPVFRLPVTTGLYVLSRAAIAAVLPEPRRLDMPDLILALAPRVAVLEHRGAWIDAGTPERLAEAAALALRQAVEA